MATAIKIMLSGGATGGPVTPLLAVARELHARNKDINFVFIGTHFGPEARLVAEVATELPIKFIPILAGKFRRYFSWQNFIDFFNIGGAFFQSLVILKTERPNLVMSAGAFVSVPLVLAAKLLSIPILIHQQDVRPGLANRLMAPFANKVSVTFEESLPIFGSKAILTGNPFVWPVLVSQENILKEFNLELSRPILLIFGGATGAVALNEAVLKNLDELLKLTQVVHLTGQGKMTDIKKADYHTFDFLPYGQVLALMSVADLVVARAGLGTITDLAALHKASILVPIPSSHQEDNAKTCSNKQAALFLAQADLNTKLVTEVAGLLNSTKKSQQLAENISHLIKPGAAAAIADLALSLVK